MSLFLQIFLLVNVFIIGILVSIAARHGYAHFHPRPEEKKSPTEEPIVVLSPAVKEQLLHAAHAKFQEAVDDAAQDLAQDLKETSIQLNGHLQKLGTGIVTNEMERYKVMLETLQKETEAAVVGSQSDIAAEKADIHMKLEEREAALTAKLDQEIAAEKERLSAQIDTKLADAVASFLVETLQHNVDLGSQTAYLTAMLEEHKADFAKEVKDEA